MASAPTSVALRPPRISAVSWSADDDLSFEHWVAQGRRMGMMSRGAQWWLGDWLTYGQARYRGRYVNAAKITGYEPQTLMNLVYVASRFGISRRRETLTWSHHAELAALAVAEQDRWLAQADAEGLSVRDLRTERQRALRSANGSGRAHVVDDCGDQVTCPECGHRFKVAARSRGVSS